MFFGRNYVSYLNLRTSSSHFSTRTWFLLVRILEGLGEPMTYSFQRVLPTLPGMTTNFFAMLS